MILALINNKGGVGKTTTAVNLAAQFAANGLEVLLVDLDPQGSASFSLGIAREDPGPSSVEVLLNRLSLRDAIAGTDVEGLDLVVGSMYPPGGDILLARASGAQSRLRQALAPVRRQYDLILLDCPPGLSILSVNGLMAADAFLVPLVPQYLALEGLERLLDAIAHLRPPVDLDRQLLGVLFTMVDRRTKLTDEVIAAVRKRFKSKVLKTEIPINVRLAQAPQFGETIFGYESWSTGAQAYTRLGGEILRRARKKKLL